MYVVSSIGLKVSEPLELRGGTVHVEVAGGEHVSSSGNVSRIQEVKWET